MNEQGRGHLGARCGTGNPWNLIGHPVWLPQPNNKYINNNLKKLESFVHSLQIKLIMCFCFVKKKKKNEKKNRTKKKL